MFSNRSFDSENNSFEPPEIEDNDERQHTEYNVLGFKFLYRLEGVGS